MEKKVAEKNKSDSTSINVFKIMQQATFKMPNVDKIQRQKPTPKLKCISGPRVASISTLWKKKRLSAQMSSSQSRSKQNSQCKPYRISRRKASMSASPSSSQPGDPRTQNASSGSFSPLTSCVTAPIAYRPINPEQSASTLS